MSEAHTLTRYLREQALKRLGLPANYDRPTDDSEYAEAWRGAALEYIAKLENAANSIFTNTDEACECCNTKEQLLETLKANYEILDKAIR